MRAHPRYCSLCAARVTHAQRYDWHSVRVYVFKATPAHHRALAASYKKRRHEACGDCYRKALEWRKRQDHEVPIARREVDAYLDRLIAEEMPARAESPEPQELYESVAEESLMRFAAEAASAIHPVAQQTIRIEQPTDVEINTRHGERIALTLQQDATIRLFPQ